MCTILATSIREYLDKNEKPANIPEEGSFVIMVNLRQTPTDSLEMKYGHNLNHGELVKMPLSGDFEKSLGRIQEQMTDFKNSNKHFMFAAAVKIGSLLFPTLIKDTQMDTIYRSMRVHLTNLCGSEEPLKFGDSALTKEILFYTYTEGHHYNTIELCICSHRGTLKMNLSAAKMKVDPRDILGIMERKLETLMTQ